MVMVAQQVEHSLRYGAVHLKMVREFLGGLVVRTPYFHC